MIGTQRSGSNLLRLMMNQLKDISSPHPPHILERMIPLMNNYGDLKSDDNFALLVDDVCRLVEMNPVEWSGVSFDRDVVMAEAKKRSLMSVYGVVYDQYAQSQGAKTWCCKSLANINYVSDIEKHFNYPKYIYLYRDGRDVALSFQKAVVGEKHIYCIAKEWADTQTKALNLSKLISQERFHSISYEQLTQQPEETARSLCGFLNTNYVPAMLDFYKTNEARNAAESSKLWGNVTNPIIQNNSKKFIKEMPTDEIGIFESVAGNMLDALGYDRAIVAKGQEQVFSSQEIESFNKLNSAKKSASLRNVDEKDMKRRRQQLDLLDEIKNRSIEFA